MPRRLDMQPGTVWAGSSRLLEHVQHAPHPCAGDETYQPVQTVGGGEFATQFAEQRRFAVPRGEQPRTGQSGSGRRRSARILMDGLRRKKLEVVVPAAQGAPHRGRDQGADDDDDGSTEDSEEEDAGSSRVQWIEDIPTGRFFLRVGLGHKASGSYYTPHAFVRFLVQETCGALVTERSPPKA